ncbi:hypothetical protein [Nocardia lijiangensis]|uniref:hypothetical protein n=1 Tax=Nocardia lijiangensis TaxID=299618 RepID=UPI003D727C4C
MDTRELPRVWVVSAKDPAFVAERLACFKVPLRWRITAEPLPRNATGKVVRREIAS